MAGALGTGRGGGAGTVIRGAVGAGARGGTVSNGGARAGGNFSSPAEVSALFWRADELAASGGVVFGCVGRLGSGVWPLRSGGEIAAENEASFRRRSRFAVVPCSRQGLRQPEK